jgi:hypothetical protein
VHLFARRGRHSLALHQTVHVVLAGHGVLRFRLYVGLERVIVCCVGSFCQLTGGGE